MNRIDGLLKEYLDHLSIEKNRSPKTRANYERCLRRFITEAKASSLEDVTEASIRAFRVGLASADPPVGKKTQAYYAVVIRNFLKYALKRGLPAVPPERIELPKIPTRQLHILEYKDLERLLAAPGSGSFRALRDTAVLETLFSTGLRISELCALDRFTDLERTEVSIRGKGGVVRVVFFSDRAKKAIKDYLAKRSDAEAALFISISGGKKERVIGRITPRAVQRLVSHYTRKAGIPDHVTPHQLRHQFATDLLVNGADLRSVQELLGHANIATTQVYTHLTDKHLKEVHQAFHGRRRKE